MAPNAECFSWVHFPWASCCFLSHLLFGRIKLFQSPCVFLEKPKTLIFFHTFAVGDTNMLTLDCFIFQLFLYCILCALQFFQFFLISAKSWLFSVGTHTVAVCFFCSAAEIVSIILGWSSSSVRASCFHFCNMKLIPSLVTVDACCRENVVKLKTLA